LLAGSLLFFVESLALSLLISGMTTVTTAVLLAVDAYRLGRANPAARQPDSPAALLSGMILIWIVVYPLAFFRRGRIGGPHLGLPAVGVALFFVAGPLVHALLRPAELPSCTDPVVVDLVEKSLRDTPDGANIESITEHKEVCRDRDLRHGVCIRYVVEWLDRDRGYSGVRVPPTELPRCTNNEVIKVFQQVIRSAPLGRFVRSIDGHREVSYDPASEVREGQCVVHLEDGNARLSYIVE